MLRSVLVAVTCVASPLVWAADISGFWKHVDEPGWIEIRLEEAKGIVVRNDKYPERVGRELLQDLVADEAEDGVWRGQVYAEKLGEYKDAEISLSQPDLMEIKVKVGFISRTLVWKRVAEIPAS